MTRAYLQGQEQEWEPESEPEYPDGLHQYHHHHIRPDDNARGLPHPRSSQ